VRVTGSNATDVVSVQLILDILQDIKEKSNVEHYQVLFDDPILRPTGSFWLDDDEGSTSSYSKVLFYNLLILIVQSFDSVDCKCRG
jgi:hypothetical protein